MKVFFSLRVVFLCACASASASAKEPTCEITNAALEAMSPVQVSITRSNGSQMSFTAKLADNNYTRAAGFQRVCASIIKRSPILFVFDRESFPSFHMNNVIAPIDIAFIRKTSSIDVIHTMQPYSLMLREKPTYSPKRFAIAALETHENFYAENNIDLQSRVTWRKLNALKE